MDLEVRVIGQQLRVPNNYYVVADSKNFLYCKFLFSPEWDGVEKTAVFAGESVYNVLIDGDGRCLVPHECIKFPSFSISVFGGDLITANKLQIAVFESGAVEGETPPAPTPDVYDQLVLLVQGEKALAQAAAQTAQQHAADAAADHAAVQNLAGQVSADAADVSADKQAVAADKLIVISERQLAETARAAAQQALSNLISMLGADIATLTDGKLTPAQIPPISINDVFEVANTAAILELDAQRGDCALIIADDVVADSYILAADDPSVLANWKKLGASYVANSGHAVTADSAANADMINGHRLVRFNSIAELEAAAKVSGTLYYAPYDEE